MHTAKICQWQQWHLHKRQKLSQTLRFSTKLKWVTKQISHTAIIHLSLLAPVSVEKCTFLFHSAIHIVHQLYLGALLYREWQRQYGCSWSVYSRYHIIGFKSCRDHFFQKKNIHSDPWSDSVCGDYEIWS